MLSLDAPAYLVLPEPISTNGLFNNLPGRGRVMTKDYKAWKVTAAKILMLQRPLPRFALPVEVTFYVGQQGTGIRDADNVVKPYLDALVENGVLHDDSRKFVRRISAVWVPLMTGCVVKMKNAGMDIEADDVRASVHANLRGLLI
ncbi:MAG: endodeoxyribonuclease RusA [Chthoniobacter sp.]|nr:endodeoxyribonuclease RusA [Chthoniobacter sp.]